MRDRLYLSLSVIYRFLLIIVVAVLHIQVKDNFEVLTDGVYLIGLLLYALGFSLLRTNKWVSFAETLVILVLLVVSGNAWFSFLLVVPFSIFVSSQINFLDNALYATLITSFMYVYFQEVLYFPIIFLGCVIVIGILQLKYNQIEYMEKEVRKGLTEAHDAKREAVYISKELETVSKMFAESRKLNEVTDIDSLKEQVLEAAKRFFNAGCAAFYLFDRQGGHFVLKQIDGGMLQGKVSQFISYEEGKRMFLTQQEMRIPIEYGEGLAGIIAVFAKRSEVGKFNKQIPSYFTQEDYELFSVYVEQVLLKMKFLHLYKSYQFLANNDELTNIPNRRHFMKILDYLIKRCGRGDDLTVIMIDVDNFKKVNDEFGHQVGDEALKLVAKVIKKALREIDVVARLGGEEFAALLPNTKGFDHIIAERIRDSVERAPFVKGRNITVSIGVARYGEHGKDEDELLLKADKACYFSKKNGKNQVNFYRGDME